LQRDPDPGKLNIPATVVNSYAYVRNNPPNLVDPTGKSFWDVALGIGAVLAGVALTAVTAGAVLVIAGAAAGVVGSIVGGGITGGIIGGIAGGYIGAQIGMAGGRLAGGLIGGGLSLIGGDAFSTGWNSGAVTGAGIGKFAGAMLGGYIGVNSGVAGSLTAGFGTASCARTFTTSIGIAAATSDGSASFEDKVPSAIGSALGSCNFVEVAAGMNFSDSSYTPAGR